MGAIAFCNWRLEGMGDTNKCRANTLVLGELTAPFLPPTCYVSEGNAIVMAREIVRGAFEKRIIRVSCPQLTESTYT